MSVYTTIETGEPEDSLTNYTVGGLVDFRGISVNDWCTREDFSLDHGKVNALLLNYNRFRAFTENEQRYWPTMLRPGELAHTRNPDEFKAILTSRVASQGDYRSYWI